MSLPVGAVQVAVTEVAPPVAARSPTGPEEQGPSASLDTPSYGVAKPVTVLPAAANGARQGALGDDAGVPEVAGLAGRVRRSVAASRSNRLQVSERWPEG